ncbi:hypothetical protein [Brevundimonas sp. DC300-4]|uniref:hypothetical protein n=1 Tax=unclassified Brevundimonas TaxID=2622653 RepID=UPI003CEE64B8
MSGAIHHGGRLAEARRDPAGVAALEAAAARLRRWIGKWPVGTDAIAMGIDF